ncbi:Mersacidin decarboxylase [Rubrobacter tropicus]|uniref:Mersacidin decarboxylase n=1 Tax=Rubrobacter tropicus TaxID=2653851 RepID=A0A6G8QA56_9ACTN|nr:flavoprotein [Rubrobacter tropicus]QIN83365.1 Mersacidin decarboxylase [Rubrobacter tropicus]
MSEPRSSIDHLLVGVSGSIAILNLPTYLVALRAAFAREVRVIMTGAAAQLLSPSTVALLCDEVFLDEVPTSQKRPGHVELANWADMFLILPASANILGQAANGLAQNLLTTTILASQTPVIFCPNLNEKMWSKEAVQRNLRTLTEDGHVVVGPKHAPAYEVGTGVVTDTLVLPEPDVLIGRLEKMLRQF